MSTLLPRRLRRLAVPLLVVAALGVFTADALIPDPDRAHLVPFATTAADRDLALALGIPMYGADPRTFHLGTKSGCRKIFSEEKVSHPLGVEDLWSVDDMAKAIADIKQSMVKRSV